MEQEREMRDYRKEAMAFWAQARADLAPAITLLDAGVYYASVFFSQQAAEKALKAAIVDRQHRSVKAMHCLAIRCLGEVSAEKLQQAFVGHLREIVVVVDGLFEQLRAIERAGCELRRPCRIDLGNFRFVRVLDAKLIAELVGDVVDIAIESIPELTLAQSFVAIGMAVPLGPHIQDLCGLVERAAMLRVQAAEIVVVFAPR